MVCASGFVGWIFLPIVDDAKMRVVVGFAGAAAALCALLYGVYAAPAEDDDEPIESGSTEELEAVLAAADEAS